MEEPFNRQDVLAKLPGILRPVPVATTIEEDLECQVCLES